MLVNGLPAGWHPDWYSINLGERKAPVSRSETYYRLEAADYTKMQAQYLKTGLDFSQYDNKMLDAFLKSIRNDEDFFQSVDKEKIFESVKNEFDRLAATYTPNRTYEEAIARVERKMMLSDIQEEFEPKYNLKCDFLGKPQEVSVLTISKNYEPILLDEYI